MGLFRRKSKKKETQPMEYKYNEKLSLNQNMTRLVLDDVCKTSVKGLDTDLLSEKMTYFYDNNTPLSERITVLMDTFEIDKKTAERIEFVCFTKTALLVDYFNNKDMGANRFDIEGKNKTLKKNIKIAKFPEYVSFIIDNNAYPVFYMK